MAREMTVRHVGVCVWLVLKYWRSLRCSLFGLVGRPRRPIHLSALHTDIPFVVLVTGNERRGSHASSLVINTTRANVVTPDDTRHGCDERTQKHTHTHMWRCILSVVVWWCCLARTFEEASAQKSMMYRVLSREINIYINIIEIIRWSG